MAENVVVLARDPHQAVQALLPWYVRGRLAPHELQELQAHLLGCAQCRAEAEAEQRQLDLPLPPEADGDVEAGLRRIGARLDAQAADRPRRPRAGKPASRPWLAGLLGLQSVAVAALLLMLVWPRLEAPAAFHGLSAGAPPAGANALLMVDPAASEAQIRRALQASGATLVGGPTATNGYLLHLPGDATQQRQALLRLRGESFVTLAEALQAGSAP
jgi:anti-sigma factor RsiW